MCLFHFYRCSWWERLNKKYRKQMHFENMKKISRSFQYDELWIQSPNPNLAKDKSLTRVPLKINGPSSRSREQRSHMLQSALQGTERNTWQSGHNNVGMAQLDTTENKELRRSPWSTQSSGFISRLNHSGRKDVGRSEVKNDSIVRLLIQIVIISKSRALQKYKVGNLT